MITSYLNFNSVSGPESPAGWIDCGSDITAGVKAANIGGTGVNFELLTAAGGESNFNGYAAGDEHGIPEPVWDNIWRTPNYETFGGRLSDLNPGQTGSVGFFGRNANAGRHRVVTYDGVEYQNDEADPPSPPTYFNFTADANGNVDFTFGYASVNANYAGLILELDETSTGPTVTADASVTPGATISHTPTDFAGSLTTATLSDGTSTVSMGSVTDTTSLAPALGNDIQYTTFGPGRTYTAGNATETADTTTALNPPAGYALVTLGATFSTDEPSYLFDYGGTPAAGDQFLYPTADSLVLNDDGSWSSPIDGTWTIYGIDASDGIMQSFPLTAGDPMTPGTVGKMTRRALTSRKITRRSLTARP